MVSSCKEILYLDIHISMERMFDRAIIYICLLYTFDKFTDNKMLHITYVASYVYIISKATVQKIFLI